MRRRTLIIGSISVLLIVIGTILKNLAMAGAGMNLSIGMGLFILGFIPLFLLDRLSTQSRKALKISTIILSIAVGLIVLAGLFKILHLPGAGALAYPSLILLVVYFVFFASQGEGRKLQLRKDRQLAAVLFTDVVGFTAMMGEDEEKALRVLEQNRKIQKKIIRKHRGKWLKEMGDGSLVIFYTATEAVTAAAEIQKEIQQSGNFNVRMGIHISEIVFTDTDVFGDGVNVAARISDKAAGNEICISEAVYQNVRNREDLRVEQLGEMEFKNVSYRLKIYKIEASGDQDTVVRKLAN